MTQKADTFLFLVYDTKITKLAHNPLVRPIDQNHVRVKFYILFLSVASPSSRSVRDSSLTSCYTLVITGDCPHIHHGASRRPRYALGEKKL